LCIKKSKKSKESKKSAQIEFGSIVFILFTNNTLFFFLILEDFWSEFNLNTQKKENRQIIVKQFEIKPRFILKKKIKQINARI
jgi:hypothetical protein